MLKNQLDDAKDRESFYQNQIETMQRLLEAPKPNMTTFTDQELVQPSIVKPDPEPDTAEAKHDGLTTLEQRENKRIPVPSTLNRNRRKEAFGAVF
jgi:hypothetical protein